MPPRRSSLPAQPPPLQAPADAVFAVARQQLGAQCACDAAQCSNSRGLVCRPAAAPGATGHGPDMLYSQAATSAQPAPAPPLPAPTCLLFLAAQLLPRLCPRDLCSLPLVVLRHQFLLHLDAFVETEPGQHKGMTRGDECMCVSAMLVCSQKKQRGPECNPHALAGVGQAPMPAGWLCSTQQEHQQRHPLRSLWIICDERFEVKVAAITGGQPASGTAASRPRHSRQLCAGRSASTCGSAARRRRPKLRLEAQVVQRAALVAARQHAARRTAKSLVR